MSRSQPTPLVALIIACSPAAAGAADVLPNAFFAMDTAIQRDLAHLDLVQELGYQGVSWYLQEAEQVRGALAEMRRRKLRMYAIYAGVTIDADGGLQVPPQLLAVLEVLKGEGTLVWLSVGGKGPPIDALTGKEPFVGALRGLADRAKVNQLRVAVYPHVGDYTPRLAEATQLVKVVNHPNFGVTFTLCHSLAGGEEARIPALLKEARPKLFSVAINGADRGVTGADWEHLIQTLDEGTLDVAGVLRELAELGYMGPIGFQGYGIKGEARSILTPTMEAWKKLSPAVAREVAGPLRPVGATALRVLLVGGRGHDWKGFHAALAPVLEKTGRFELQLTERLEDLTADHLSKYNILLFYGSGGEFNRPAQEEAIGEFVRRGGGLAGVHATDAFKQSDLYWRLLGSRFTTHGGGRFTVRIEDRTHPVTAAMADFEIEDESYQGELHPEFRLCSLGRIDRGAEQQSMIWVQLCGRGRVFNTTLGHGEAAWKNPHFQRLVVRGLCWSAGYEPLELP